MDIEMKGQVEHTPVPLEFELQMAEKAVEAEVVARLNRQRRIAAVPVVGGMAGRLYVVVVNKLDVTGLTDMSQPLDERQEKYSLLKMFGR